MELLTGAILGVICAVIFQPPLERLRSYILARARKIWFSIRKATPLPATEAFTLAKRTFPFLVVDGDGQHTYAPSRLTCVLDSDSLELPLEVEAIRAEVERREDEKRKAAQPFQWNGPQLAIKRYAIGRTVPNEEMELRLVLQRTDYFAFQATVLSLDRKLTDGSTLRKKYLTPPPAEPVSFLAIGLGVAIVLISSDEKFILSRRSAHSGARPGELDISFVEGVHSEKDGALDPTGPDLYHAAIRGAEEEVGIKLEKRDIQFLGFGVDLDFYQWNMLGVARLSQSAKDALAHRTRGRDGKWEVREFQVVDANPDAVWKFLSGEKLWATGWVALYWALVREYGKAKVDASALKYLR